MNKLIITAVAAFLLAGIASAQPMDGFRPDKGDRPSKEEMRAHREEMKKHHEEISALLQKYNKEKNTKKKAAIENEIKSKIAASYDKRLAHMKERLEKAQQGLAKAQERLAEESKPEFKEKKVAEMTKNILEGKAFGPKDKASCKDKNCKDGKDCKCAKDDKKCDCGKDGKEPRKFNHGPRGFHEGYMPPPPPPDDDLEE